MAGNIVFELWTPKLSSTNHNFWTVKGRFSQISYWTYNLLESVEASKVDQKKKKVEASKFDWSWYSRLIDIFYHWLSNSICQIYSNEFSKNLYTIARPTNYFNDIIFLNKLSYIFVLNVYIFYLVFMGRNVCLYCC